MTRASCFRGGGLTVSKGCHELSRRSIVPYKGWTRGKRGDPRREERLDSSSLAGGGGKNSARIPLATSWYAAKVRSLIFLSFSPPFDLFEIYFEREKVLEKKEGGRGRGRKGIMCCRVLYIRLSREKETKDFGKDSVENGIRS